MAVSSAPTTTQVVPLQLTSLATTRPDGGDTLRNGAPIRRLEVSSDAVPLRPTAQHSPSLRHDAPRMVVAFFEISATLHVAPPLLVMSTTGLPVEEVPTAVQVEVELHDIRTGVAMPSWNGAPPAAQSSPEPHDTAERLAPRNGLGCPMPCPLTAVPLMPDFFGLAQAERPTTRRPTAATASRRGAPRCMAKA